MQILSRTTADTEQLGNRLAERILLRPQWAKTILLTGELGSGKTTFTRGFAAGLGITEPISSPTYALVAEYALPENKNGLKKFVHIDLYRSDTGSALSASEIEEIIADETVVVAIEWPERLPPEKLPQNRIELRLAATDSGVESERQINLTLHDRGIPTQGEITDLYKEFAVPQHVRTHIATVTKVADYFAEQLMQNNVPINRELVHAGAMLHDFVRVCNFKNFDPQCFFEALSPHKLGVWKKLVAKFGNQHHGDAGAEILEKRGFIATADIVRNHHTAAALKELMLEEKCVLLADRHVLHDKIVSLEERIDDAGKRNHHDGNPKYAEIKQQIQEYDEEIRRLTGGFDVRDCRL